MKYKKKMDTAFMHAIAAMAKRRLKKIMTSKRLGRHLRVLPPLTN